MYTQSPRRRSTVRSPIRRSTVRSPESNVKLYNQTIERCKICGPDSVYNNVLSRCEKRSNVSDNTKYTREYQETVRFCDAYFTTVKVNKTDQGLYALIRKIELPIVVNGKNLTIGDLDDKLPVSAVTLTPVFLLLALVVKLISSNVLVREDFMGFLRKHISAEKKSVSWIYTLIDRLTKPGDDKNQGTLATIFRLTGIPAIASFLGWTYVTFLRSDGTPNLSKLATVQVAATGNEAIAPMTTKAGSSGVFSIGSPISNNLYNYLVSQDAIINRNNVSLKKLHLDSHEFTGINPKSIFFTTFNNRIIKVQIGDWYFQIPVFLGHQQFLREEKRVKEKLQNLFNGLVRVYNHSLEEVELIRKHYDNLEKLASMENELSHADTALRHQISIYDQNKIKSVSNKPTKTPVKTATTLLRSRPAKLIKSKFVGTGYTRTNKPKYSVYSSFSIKKAKNLERLKKYPQSIRDQYTRVVLLEKNIEKFKNEMQVFDSKTKKIYKMPIEKANEKYALILNKITHTIPSIKKRISGINIDNFASEEVLIEYKIKEVDLALRSTDLAHAILLVEDKARDVADMENRLMHAAKTVLRIEHDGASHIPEQRPIATASSRKAIKSTASLSQIMDATETGSAKSSPKKLSPKKDSPKKSSSKKSSPGNSNSIEDELAKMFEEVESVRPGTLLKANGELASIQTDSDGNDYRYKNYEDEYNRKYKDNDYFSEMLLKGKVFNIHTGKFI